VDGKTLRGTGPTQAAMTVLLAVATHTDGIVLGQSVVPADTTEISSVATVLNQIDPTGTGLDGTVVTLDALHTVRETATTITGHHADYVMTVKANTAHLQAAIHEQFTNIPDAAAAPADDRPQEDTTTTIGHGRTEQRTLRVIALPEPGRVGGVAFPDAAQVFRVVRYRGGPDGQRTSKEVVYGITSLTRDAAGAAELNTLVRGHWSIENKVHHVRDLTFDEDRQRARTANAPAVLATLRNIIIAAIRRTGATNIAAARRAASSNPHTAIAWFNPPTNPDTNPL
jgi:predicted transposase YbfD/YdcC